MAQAKPLYIDEKTHERLSEFREKRKFKKSITLITNEFFDEFFDEYLKKHNSELKPEYQTKDGGL